MTACWTSGTWQLSVSGEPLFRSSASSRDAPSIPKVPPTTKAPKMRWGVMYGSARLNAYVTKVTGTKKLPSRMMVGIRLLF